MKKYIILITAFAVADVVISMLISVRMMAIQTNYLDLRQKESALIEENNQLAREAAHLSSLKNIQATAENLGLNLYSDKQVVYIEKDAFAALK